MTTPFGSFPYDAAGVDNFAHPLFINAMRAPSTQDLYPAGTQWMDGSVSPKVIYQTTGGGVWIADATINPTFTTLTVTGQSTLGATTIVGTTLINASGAAATTIGTGGTGAVNIGNATGNTAVTGALSTTTILTAGTGITATTGNITATNGDLVLGTTGNKIQIPAATAASDSVGTATLNGSGTVVVSTTAVTTNSLIFVTINTPTAPGILSVPSASIVDGVSFVINSDSGTDASTVNYWIIN